MEFLGIGPLELFFIILIALIVLGPKDMVKAGRTIGRFLRTLATSPTWRTIQQTSRDLRYLPNRLMREAGLEELKESFPDSQSLRKEIGLDQLDNDMKQWQNDLGSWSKPSTVVIDSPPSSETTTEAKDNPQTAIEQESEAEVEPETPSTLDLSAWTTPPNEKKVPRDGKTKSASPSVSSDSSDPTPKTQP
jgi:Sec-independent protein translocase protein TatA